MNFSPFRSLGFVALICAVTSVGACRTMDDLWKEDAANRLAVPANLHKRQVMTGPYAITYFERTYKRGEPATIYIEGDGLDSMDKNHLSDDPTPDYPVALHLATRDLGDNVIYLARPCQYTALEAHDSVCAPAAFTSDRFSLEALTAMNNALDALKSRYDLTGFNLVGYDGGATVAALLAAKRKDVLSLRTVAGMLDTGLIPADSVQAVSLGALNPKDFARDLAAIPQHHFYGTWDQTIPPSAYDGFRAAMGESVCARMSVVDEVNHEEGWANRWPSLLEQPVDCKAR